MEEKKVNNNKKKQKKRQTWLAWFLHFCFRPKAKEDEKKNTKTNSYFFMILSHAKSETNQNAAHIGRGRE